MKQPNFKRYPSSIILILSALGLLFSVVSIILIWAIRPQVVNGAFSVTEILLDVLSTTDDGLIVLDSTLGNATEDLAIIESSFLSLDTTFDSVAKSLENSSDLIGDDLRLTVIDSETALSSAASSAEIIDTTLSFISRIPFVGADYEPEVPLHTSLTQVAGTLGTIPESLDDIETSLDDTAESLLLTKSTLSNLANNINALEEDLENAQIVLSNYRQILAKSIEKSTSFSESLPRIMTMISLVFSGVLFWLGVAQFNVLLQGYYDSRSDEKVVSLADIHHSDKITK